MWPITPEFTFIFFSCMLGVFALLGYAWVELYRSWKIKAHDKPSVHPIATQISWLILLIATIFGSGFMLWFFWTAISVLYF